MKNCNGLRHMTLPIDPPRALRTWPFKSAKAIRANGYYQANLEERRAERMRRYWSNPEHHREINRRSRDKNKEKVKARNRAYREQYAERKREKNRIWRDSNRDKVRAYQREHYHRHKAQITKRRRFLYKLRGRPQLTPPQST